MILFLFLFICCSFNVSSETLSIDQSHYLLRRQRNSNNSKQTNQILSIFSETWKFNVALTSLETSYINSFQSILNLQDIDLELEIVNKSQSIEETNRYNTIIYYKSVLKLLENQRKDILKQINKTKEMYSLYSNYDLLIQMENKLYDTENTLLIIKNKLDNLLLNNKNSIITTPKPEENFIIPIKYFNKKKTSILTKNSFYIRYFIYLVQVKYSCFSFPLLMRIQYILDKNKDELKLIYKYNFKDFIKNKEIEIEFLIYKLHIKVLKIFTKIEHLYKISMIYKLRIEKIQSHIVFLKNYIKKLEKTNDIRLFSKINKYKMTIWNLKQNLLKLQLEQTKNLWMIFLELIPLDFCSKVFIYRPLL